MWHPALDPTLDVTGVRIVEQGREALFLLLLGLVGSFLFIRFSVRMIRRGTSWWPGNVTPGGLHIHHVVFGQALMLICGVAGFTVRGEGGGWRLVFAAGFGIGAGLVLDEFALVLHLEDVYWSERGRTSVDAVVLAVSMIGLLLLGELPFGGFQGPLTAGQVVGAVILLSLVGVTLLKGKTWTGLLGIMLWPLALVGAVRLARPHSPWARWRYRSRPRRMARADRREARIHRRLQAARISFYDAVAGAPDAVLERRRAAAVEPPPPPPPPAAPLQPWRIRCALTAEWYVRIAALLNVAAGLVEPFRTQVQQVNTGQYFTPVLMTAGFTAALFAGLLSVMLRRRKRAAWMATTIVVGVYSAAFVAAMTSEDYRSHPFNWASAAITLALLVLLVLGRGLFRVRSERGDVTLAVAVLVTGLALLTLVGAAVVRLTYAEAPPSWGAAVLYVLLRLITLSGIIEYSDIDVPGWVDLGLNLLGAALLLLSLRVLFRSPRGRLRLRPEDERRLRALLDGHGAGDSLGYFALRRDKAACWSPTGEAAVVHRVVNGVSLVSGDPVGAPEHWPGAIEAWIDQARGNAWIPAVTGAGRRGSAAYARHARLHVVELGEEAVVETTGFTLTGQAMTPLRETRDRVRAAGYRALVRRHRDIPAAELADLARLADAWRHGRTERGFATALGRLGDPDDGDCLLAECRDENDRVCALLNLVPWGAHGLTLDLIRRDRESDEGLAEYLITEVLLASARGDLHVTRVSLNYAAFRTAEQRRARPAAGGLLLRLVRAVLRLLVRWWRRESLYRSHARFHPDWRPRFALYDKPTELPAIATAAAGAEGLLTRPRLRRGRAAPTPAALTGDRHPDGAAGVPPHDGTDSLA
ncbi:phosphatidylglycerol lysyltransferase domain-containing protein [Kitasatospora camelliae]|uniref:Phosphatidylglycerol lysyltransferase domain-containing protein n=1 Tax=Kitasatospora camelliae TaxID=3156397 RepID=A0AAU8JU27_9ACTN